MAPGNRNLQVSRPSWHCFSLLGASCSHFVPRAAFAVALGRFCRVLGRSGLDFRAFRVVPGRVLEPPGASFSRFSCAYALALSERSECDQTTVLLDRNTCCKQHAQCENSRKIVPGVLPTKLSVTIVPQTRLGAHRARFWRILAPSRACLGRVRGALGLLLATLGRLLGALGHLLAASRALLAASELSSAPPGSILERFGCLRAGFRRALGAIFANVFEDGRIYMVHEFLIETHITIHSSFSFTPCSAAVRAQHMELALKASKNYSGFPFLPS